MKNITLHVGVKVLLQREDGKYLFIKRSAQKYAFMQERIGWDAVGGLMFPDYTIPENLQLRMMQEVGPTQMGELILLGIQDIFFTDNDGENRHVVRLTYKTSCNDFEVKINPEETAEYIWARFDEISENEMDTYLREIYQKNKALL